MVHTEIERRLRTQLQTVVGRLGQAATRGLREPTSDLGSTRGDLLEDAQLGEAREGGLLARERLARQARNLVLALQRLEAGSYGTCAECDEVIGAARLRAIPSATRCLACQERFENGRTAHRPASKPRTRQPRPRPSGRGRSSSEVVSD